MEPAASWAGQECDGGDMGESHSMLRRPGRSRYAVATGCCFVLFGLIHCVRFELCFVSCFRAGYVLPLRARLQFGFREDLK